MKKYMRRKRVPQVKCKWNTKWNKGSGDLRARFHSATFSTCKKELKRSLELGVVGHNFNINTGKAKLDH